MTTCSIQLPLDNGFLRRECPKCERQFKWHHGPAYDRPPTVTDPDVYVCPYCAETAPADHWWTREQLEYAKQMIAGPAMHILADTLLRSFKNNSMIELSVRHDEYEPATTLYEPHDMEIVQPPCHPWEPLKISSDWRRPIHCIICGAAFAVD